MKNQIFILLFFLASAFSNEVFCQYDSLGYIKILEGIDTIENEDFLSSIELDTVCINQTTIDIQAYEKNTQNNVSERVKQDAFERIDGLTVERDECYKSLKDKYGKHSTPVEFVTEPFKKIKGSLGNVDQDNGIGSALMDGEKALIDSIEYLKNQLAIANQNGPAGEKGTLKNNLIQFLLPLLLLIGFVTALAAYIMNLFKIRLIKSNFQNESHKKDDKISSLQQELDIMKRTSNSTSSGNSSPPENAASVASTLTTSPTPSFFAESFVSAGPRKLFFDDKGEGDIDLGEDIAGFIVGGSYSAFWVLDGTSGQDKLSTKDDRIKLGERGEEYFSSRLLAQNIAWNLHGVIKKYGFKNSSFDLLKEAIMLTEINWQNKINGLGDADKHELRELLLEKNMLMCSTTIAFGILGMNKELDATISGDCILATHPKQIDLGKNNRRQSANLYLENGQIKIDFNQIKKDNCLVIRESNIDKVIAMSDGISKTTQKWMSSNSNIDFTNPQIRESLARLKQKTQDDKSITIIQIL